MVIFLSRTRSQLFHLDLDVLLPFFHAPGVALRAACMLDNVEARVKSAVYDRLFLFVGFLDLF